MLVRARVELTTLALSAPRSADWANRPDILHSFLVRCVCLQERHSIKWVTHGKAILHQVALKKAPVSLAKGQVPWKTKQKNSKLSSRSLWVSLWKTTKNHLYRILLKICRKRILLAYREISQSLLRNLNEILLDFFFPQVAGRGISSNGRALA